jgi:tRNA 5-methylaminomethyl-2-thiouridine biosynthesis bifunctional protein
MFPLLPKQTTGNPLNSWVVLDTAFAGGFQFLSTWRAWQENPQRPRMLHYVALLQEEAVPDWFEFPEHYDYDPTLKKLANQLADLCDGAQRGFQRMLLDDGQVSLTLCIGEVPNLLGALRLQADVIWMDVFQQPWDMPTLKPLARYCKRGTILHLSDMEESLLQRLQEQGFQAASSHSPLQYVFDPPWDIKTSRQPHLALAHSPTHCAVIGAGLSGACVAQALARRGWHVTVYERNATAAQEASGVPAAVVVPYLTGDNSPRSQISSVGTRLMLQHAQRFLQQGTDWDATGVQEHRFHQHDRLQPIWHTHAGWIKPSALVSAWLAHPNIRFVGNMHIHAIKPVDSGWELLDADNHRLTSTDIVVLANAKDSFSMSGLSGLHAIDGTMSFGKHADIPTELSDWPHYPVNGHGNFIPAVPTDTGMQWIAGATFHAAPAQNNPETPAWSSDHQFNFSRLQTLLPHVARDLQPIFAREAVQSWSASRCVTPDRMPWVGAIQPNLWINVGMGARGLSFAAVCTELLVAQLCGEPWPLPHTLARGLDVQRVTLSA